MGKIKNRNIKVDYLARVEGEGAIYVKVKDNVVEEVQVNIFEPPRFFEAFLRGRKFSEAPDITARICGICPIAYQMSSVHAMESALGVTVGGQLRTLRRLLYCGEWIESHVLHMFMLHAPDFLGYQDALQLAKDMPEVVKKALALKKVGNDIVNLVGGREIHPINVKVGGFYKVPTKKELLTLVDKLKHARDEAVEAVKLVATFPFPDFEQEYEFVALRHPTEYPFNEGRLVSSKGMDIEIKDYENYFQEGHVQHSNALQSTTKGGQNYFVGPIARYNLNYDRLSPLAKEAAKSVGLGTYIKNPFKSIIVRGVETVYALDEALRIIDQYVMPERPSIDITPKAGIGWGCTEAPRGILYHRYRIDANGDILDAKITPPTAQNLRTMESDLEHLVPQNLHLDDSKLTWLCEQAIRCYDPCISCATHYLTLHIDRS